MLQNVMDK
jgi:cytoskeleton-associated protein 5